MLTFLPGMLALIIKGQVLPRTLIINVKMDPYFVHISVDSIARVLLGRSCVRIYIDPVGIMDRHSCKGKNALARKRNMIGIMICKQIFFYSNSVTNCFFIKI